MEAHRYITPRGLHLDYTLPRAMRIELPDPARDRLSSILAAYNREIHDWFDEVAYHVIFRRNLPFATIYFDKQYPLGGYISANRWDKYDSPYQYYSSNPDPEMKFAGCWWFRTKERLEYASQRSSVAAKAWELLYDKNEFVPWVVFSDPLDDDFVCEAAKYNENLETIRRMDADLEEIFPFNGEEVYKFFQGDMEVVFGGTKFWHATPMIAESLDEILHSYGKKSFDLITKISNVYNKLSIKPWLTVWLDREYDLLSYFLNDCGLIHNEIKAIPFTDDFSITPDEFDGHVPIGILYFITREDVHMCAKKSSLIARWWEKVKDLRADRGWLYVPKEGASSYETTDLFVPAGVGNQTGKK